MMTEAVLILVLLGVFAFGFFLMRQLDHFLSRSADRLEKPEEVQEPACVLLTQELSDEEIAEEIRRFRSHHSEVKILLSGSCEPRER